MSSTICFLDFDKTLFDSHQWYADMRNFFRQFGVSDVLWAETYAASRGGLYSVGAHIAAMQKHIPDFPAAEAQEKFFHTFTDLRAYLYPDVVSFLESAVARGISLCLLSHGDPAWQRYKLGGARITDYFDDLFFTNREGAKYVHIEEAVALYPRIIYVDDNLAELDIAKRTVASCETYFIHRLPGVHDASAAVKHRVCHTLGEVFSI